MKLQPIKQISRYTGRLTSGMCGLEIFGNFFNFDVQFWMDDETKAFPFIFTFVEPRTIERHFHAPKGKARTLEINGHSHMVFKHSLENFSERDKGKATEVYVVYLNEYSGITPNEMLDDDIKLRWMLQNEIIDPDIAKVLLKERDSESDLVKIALGQLASVAKKPVGKKYSALKTNVTNLIRMNGTISKDYLYFDETWIDSLSEKFRVGDNFFVLPPGTVAHIARETNCGCISVTNTAKVLEFKDLSWINSDNLSEGLFVSESTESLYDYKAAKEYNRYKTPEQKMLQILSVVFSSLAGEEVCVSKVHLSLQTDMDKVGVKGLYDPKFIGILPLVTFDAKSDPIIYPFKGGRSAKGFAVYQDELNKDEFMIVPPKELWSKSSMIESVINTWNQFFEQFDMMIKDTFTNSLYGGGGHRILDFNKQIEYYFTEEEIESHILVLESEA